MATATRPPTARRPPSPILRNDQRLLAAVMASLLNKPPEEVKRGDRELAYRKLAHAMSVSPATPRTWFWRVKSGRPLGTHLRRLLRAQLEGTSVQPPPLPLGDTADPDDLRYLLGRIRHLHHVTQGRGPDWAIVERAVDLVESFVRLREES